MKFGTSGLRGLASDLTTPVSARYCQAFLEHLEAHGLFSAGSNVFLGRDYRSSSPELLQYCAAGIKQAGGVPVDCGVLPTPALAHHAMQQDSPSIMITGSHIPEDRNGIKFYRPDGEITKSDEAAICERVEQSPGSNLLPQNVDQNQSEAAQFLFMERLEQMFPDGQNALLSGMRVGVYEHSSVGRDMLIRILQFYGATVVRYGRSERFIAVDTEALSDETRQLLKTQSVQHQLDAIVSTDGDADRPLLADETGSAVPGDLLGMITAEFITAEAIVTPISSNSGIAFSAGDQVSLTKIGSPYVLEKIAEKLNDGKRTVGFEANGGFILASSFQNADFEAIALPTRDCFLPVLAVLATAARQKRSLSDLIGQLGYPVTRSGLLRETPKELSRALLNRLQSNPNALAEFLSTVGEVQDTNSLDGLRIRLNEDRIVHLRPSGNAPEMRCYVEASSAAVADELLALMLKLISAALHNQAKN